MEAVDWAPLDWNLQPTEGIVVFKTVFNGVEVNACLTDKWNTGHMTWYISCLVDGAERWYSNADVSKLDSDARALVHGVLADKNGRGA